MKVLADFCVIPMGVGVSVSAYVAECERVLAESGLTFTLHANGTNVQGEWDEVFDALRLCHERIHAMGCPRITTTVTFGTRTDRDQTLDEKVASVERRLAE